MMSVSASRHKILCCFGQYLFQQRAVHLSAIQCVSLSRKRRKVAVPTLNSIRETMKDFIGAQRLYAEGTYDRSDLLDVLPKSQEELPPKRMSDSYSEGIIPLASDIETSEKYLNVHKSVRFGRILEDLDTFAVYISYKHCKDPSVTGKSPLSIVTAAVDQISLHRPVLADQDVKLCGNVTWAGRTSLEVTMTLEQKQEDTVKKLLEAQFVLVARDPVNKNSAFVNPLQADTADEERIMKLGEANKMKRQEESKRSLLLMAPNENERFLIHKLFLETIDPKAVSFKVRIKPENCVWLSSTMLKNLIICHPEERNMYNKIFGGFLMRQAYELGWANSFMFSQERCQLNQVDSIIFRKPVEIGALLFFSSQVVYTEGRFIQVRVHAENVDPTSGVHETTNIFQFTFESKNKNMPRVIPQTYAEAMLYLDGKRNFMY